MVQGTSEYAQDIDILGGFFCLFFENHTLDDSAVEGESEASGYLI